MMYLPIYNNYIGGWHDVLPWKAENVVCIPGGCTPVLAMIWLPNLACNVTKCHSHVFSTIQTHAEALVNVV